MELVRGVGRLVDLRGRVLGVRLVVRVRKVVVGRPLGRLALSDRKSVV